MRKLAKRWPALACASVAAIALAGTAQAEMTKEARAFLSKGGIADELIKQANAATKAEFAIPQEWIDKAKEEGPVQLGTNDTAEHVAKWLPLFQARYPGIEVEAEETSGAARAVQPLLAFKAGKLVRHIVNAFEGTLQDYMEADALEEIDDLPAWNGVPEDRRDPKGRYSGLQNTTWCLGYNKELISKDKLPATWGEMMAPGSPLAAVGSAPPTGPSSGRSISGPTPTTGRSE